MRIIVFGDSISEGFWDYENGGWVNRLKIDFWKKYGYEKMIFNAGISAYTTENILNYFSDIFSAVSKREASKEKDTIVIFAIGINDASKTIITGKSRVDIRRFEENIQTLIEICQSERLIHNVIFLGNINVDEDIINNENNLENEHFYYNSEIQKYNKVIEELAIKTTCSYIDISGIVQKEDLEDGLHPNSQGHKKIYKKVLNYLENKLWNNI